MNQNESKNKNKFLKMAQKCTKNIRITKILKMTILNKKIKMIFKEKKKIAQQKKM